MRKFISLVFVLCHCSVYAAQGNLLHTADRMKTFPTSELMRLANKRNPFAVAELGRRKEKTAIPLLEQIANEPDLVSTHPSKPHSMASERKQLAHVFYVNMAHKDARKALALMGVDTYITEYIVGLSTTNGAWREECMDTLAEIGDKRAIKYLLPILDENNIPPGTVLPSYSITAQLALKQLLPDAWKELMAKTPSRVPTRAEWELWVTNHPGADKN